MDIFILKALIDDLQQRVVGAVVSKVFQISPHELLLRLWRHQDLRLLLSVHPQWQRLHLTTDRFRTPQRPPRFAALLRARLQQVRLRSITLHPYERVVALTWERWDEPEPALTLIHELYGAQANILLVDAAGIIIDALKPRSAETTHDRPLEPGQPYHPRPLPPQRVLVSDVTVDHVQQLQRQGQFDAAHLQRLIIGLTPVLAAELVHRSQGSPQACCDILDVLRQRYDAQTLTLSLWTSPNGAKQLTVLPYTHLAGACEAFPHAQDAAAALYQPAIVEVGLERERQGILKTVQQRLRKLRKKINNITQDQQKLDSYLPYQRYGTLLVAQHLPRGATSASVVDYYDPAQPMIVIPLDPRLSVRDNTQVYFKKYRKTQTGLATIRMLLAQCAEEEQYLDGLAQQITQAEDWPTLEMITAELGGNQVPAVPQHRLAARPQPAAASPYRTFTSRDGYTLYCGKSNQGNDALLRQIAQPEDLWFHAYQQAGAHVVLKVQPHEEVPGETLHEAAALAAFYSKGKQAATVEVLYTQVKHVRKFRGARPGQVRVETYRTLEVTPQLPTSG